MLLVGKLTIVCVCLCIRKMNFKNSVYTVILDEAWMTLRMCTGGMNSPYKESMWYIKFKNMVECVKKVVACEYLLGTTMIIIRQCSSQCLWFSLIMLGRSVPKRTTPLCYVFANVASLFGGMATRSAILPIEPTINNCMRPFVEIHPDETRSSRVLNSICMHAPGVYMRRLWEPVNLPGDVRIEHWLATRLLLCIDKCNMAGLIRLYATLGVTLDADALVANKFDELAEREGICVTIINEDYRTSELRVMHFEPETARASITLWRCETNYLPVCSLQSYGASPPTERIRPVRRAFEGETFETTEEETISKAAKSYMLKMHDSVYKSVEAIKLFKDMRMSVQTEKEFAMRVLLAGQMCHFLRHVEHGQPTN
eukprot:GHVR01130145.1.p1 GENE.GHVR01130145.1~~GHVR01130145.1.p1  ORF type:complete len:370 (+),score=33.59 GHVR01130145.1:423-1532(+)